MNGDHFTNTFVINMDKDKDRLERITEQLSTLGVKWERFSGININENKEHKNLYPLSFFCKNFCTDGIIGCAFSHVSLWSKISSLPEGKYLILEDDAVFVDDFWNKYQLFYRHVPSDWDMLLLGCFFCSANKVGTLESIVQNFSKKNLKINDHVMKINRFSGLHAYILNPKGAQKLLTLIPTISQHVDVHVANISRKINLYSPRPHLANQHIETESSNNINTKKPFAVNLVSSYIPINKSFNLDYTLSIPIGKIGLVYLNAICVLSLIAGFILSIFFPLKIILIIMSLFILVDFGFCLVVAHNMGVKGYATVVIPFLIGLLVGIVCKRWFNRNP